MKNKTQTYIPRKGRIAEMEQGLAIETNTPKRRGNNMSEKHVCLWCTKEILPSESRVFNDGNIYHGLCAEIREHYLARIMG